jgi:hypothetical protein
MQAALFLFVSLVSSARSDRKKFNKQRNCFLQVRRRLVLPKAFSRDISLPIG